jgi:hypothetical protein
MKTASWVILALVGVLTMLGSMASCYVAYRARDEQIGPVSLSQVAGGQPELATALRARRGTAAAYAGGFAALFLAITLGPYRRGDAWAWWALLGGTAFLSIVILLRVPFLDTKAGAWASRWPSTRVGSARVCAPPRLRADRPVFRGQALGRRHELAGRCFGHALEGGGLPLREQQSADRAQVVQEPMAGREVLLELRQLVGRELDRLLAAIGSRGGGHGRLRLEVRSRLVHRFDQQAQILGRALDAAERLVGPRFLTHEYVLHPRSRTRVGIRGTMLARTGPPREAGSFASGRAALA